MATDDASLATGANAIETNTTVAADRTRQAEHPSADASTSDAPDDDSADAPAAGVAPPSPGENENSKKVTLADLCARAATLYAHRKYADACETYAHAAELQAELRGDLDPENAEILFLYGRALFKVGQAESDVLGGRAPVTESSAARRAAAKGVGRADLAAETEVVGGKKGLVQFDEDENLDGDDDNEEEEEEEEGETEEGKEADEKAGDVEAMAVEKEGEDGDGDGDDDAEEGDEAEKDVDDLQQAFQALDLAGVLFRKKLAALKGTTDSGEDKDKQVATGTSTDDGITRHIKERLGDTHEYLAEISLENERFPAAIDDCRAALVFKTDLYPPDSEVVAEAHFKLSLALEFASVTTTAQDGDDGKAGGADGDKPRETAAFDQGLRDEAARELEAAVECVKLKIASKEVDLATMASPEENDATRAAIAESREILADMEQRLVDLRKPPVDVAAALESAAPEMLSGLLGAAAKEGESAEQTAARVAEASRNAADLTGLVRKKDAGAGGTGKRKAEGDPAADDVAASREGPGPDNGAKKARVEEAAET